jgi:hypothetical protein
MVSSIDSATYAVMQAAPDKGISKRDLVTFFVRSLDGLTTTSFSFWDDLDTVTIPILRPDTGATENRDFVGDGSLISISPIKYVTDLTVQTVTITLSQIHPLVLDMSRGWDIRGGKVEVHRAVFDPQTHALAGIPRCRFRGKVNKAPNNTAAVGGEGALPIEVASIVRDLTRNNPAKKSDETQKRRSGDRLRRHTGTANVDIWWGQEREKTKK